MKFKAIVSGHIYLNKHNEKEVKIYSQIDDDDRGLGIFHDIEFEIMDVIHVHDSEGRYFIAIIESELTILVCEDEEIHQVDHKVTEARELKDFTL